MTPLARTFALVPPCCHNGKRLHCRQLEGRNAKMTAGRFTDRAQASRSASPQKVSKKEGYWILLMSGLTFLFVSIHLISQTSSSVWLSVAYVLSPFLYLLSTLAVAVGIRETRKVQPYGWKRAYVAATLLSIAVVVIGEWSWANTSGDANPPAVAFLIAALTAIPFAGLGAWKVKSGS